MIINVRKFAKKEKGKRKERTSDCKVIKNTLKNNRYQRKNVIILKYFQIKHTRCPSKTTKAVENYLIFIYWQNARLTAPKITKKQKTSRKNLVSILSVNRRLKKPDSYGKLHLKTFLWCKNMVERLA